MSHVIICIIMYIYSISPYLIDCAVDLLVARIGQGTFRFNGGTGDDQRDPIPAGESEYTLPKVRRKCVFFDGVNME